MQEKCRSKLSNNNTGYSRFSKRVSHHADERRFSEGELKISEKGSKVGVFLRKVSSAWASYEKISSLMALR